MVVGLLVGCGGGEGDASESGADGTWSDPPSTGGSSTGTFGDVSGEPPVTTGELTSGSSSGDAEATSTSEPTGGSSGDETGPPVVEDVPVFIAQGHYGRTTISCDDGRTWVQDHSADDAVRCFENDVDCDHNEFAGRGVAYGDGVFVLTWGWGHPGTLARSEDAAQFTTVLTETPTFADVAFGNGRFVANNSPTRISDDGGKTWGDGGPLDININTRAIEFVPHDGGVFIVAGESGETRAIVRSVDGVTWTPASQKPPECAAYTRGMAYGGGVVVMASGNGSVCSSGDGGDTWTYTKISEGLSSPPVPTLKVPPSMPTPPSSVRWRSAQILAASTKATAPTTKRLLRTLKRQNRLRSSRFCMSLTLPA